MKKTNILQKIRIILSSAFLTVYFSSIVLWRRKHLDRKGFDHFIRRWAKCILKQVNARYHIHNPHHTHIDPTKPTIIMCNHSSLYDIPLILLSLPGSIRMFAKKELARIPIMGRMMQHFEFPFIDRFNRKQIIKDLNHAKRLMESGIILWIAPEGTRSLDGQLGPLKDGGFLTALQAHAQIIPVGIRHAHQLLPAKTWQFHLDTDIDIHIGQIIETTHMDKKDRKTLQQSVEQQLRQLLAQDQPSSQQT